MTGRDRVIAMVSAATVALATPALSQNRPEDFPGLDAARDFVAQHLTSRQLYWLLFDAGPGNTPYLAYCTETAATLDAMRGRVIVAARGSHALSYFSTISGRGAQVLPADQIDAALARGQIDCVGFGGGPAPQGSGGIDWSLFNEAEIEQAARRFDIPLDDTLFTRPGVLRWSLYRVARGDVATTQRLLHALRLDAFRNNRPNFDHFAGFLAVRAYERVADPTRLDEAGEGRAARGQCGEMPEFCKGIEMELARLGVYNGPIDGTIGAAAQAAIRRIAGTRPQADPAALMTMDEMLGPPAAAEGDARPDAPPIDLPNPGALDDF